MKYIFKNKTKKDYFETEDVVEAWNYYCNCNSDDLEFSQKFNITGFEDLDESLPLCDNQAIEIALTTSLAYVVNQLRRENEALNQNITDLEDEIERLS